MHCLLNKGCRVRLCACFVALFAKYSRSTNERLCLANRGLALSVCGFLNCKCAFFPFRANIFQLNFVVVGNCCKFARNLDIQLSRVQRIRWRRASVLCYDFWMVLGHGILRILIWPDTWSLNIRKFDFGTWSNIFTTELHLKLTAFLVYFFFLLIDLFSSIDKSIVNLVIIGSKLNILSYSDKIYIFINNICDSVMYDVYICIIVVVLFV